MEDKEYEPPIIISGVDGKIRIAYDEVEVNLPKAGPLPADTPPLACRIFEAFMGDLPGHLRAE